MGGCISRLGSPRKIVDAAEGQITALVSLIWPSAQTIFSPDKSRALTWNGHLLINRMKLNIYGGIGREVLGEDSVCFHLADLCFEKLGHTRWRNTLPGPLGGGQPILSHNGKIHHINHSVPVHISGYLPFAHTGIVRPAEGAHIEPPAVGHAFF
jgi:hypothetical protein